MSNRIRIRNFLRRGPRDQLFFVRCLFVVAVMRVALSTVGYKALSGYMPRETAERPATLRDLARVSWGVRNAARLVPGASCLTQALAGHYLLRRQHFPGLIRIGAKTKPEGGFAAHAWLLSGDTVVLGGGAEDLSTFSHLTDLGA